MLGYLTQRVLQSVIVMVVVAAIAFLMFNFIGDPLVAILGSNSTGLQREQLRVDLGLDRPAIIQFGDFMWRSLQGDFGISYRLGQPVGKVLVERLPATVELAVSGMLLAILLGVPAGVFAALHRRRLSTKVMLAGSLFGISVPSFFMGVLFIWIFSVELRWLPSFGRGDTVSIGWWSTGLLTIDGLRSLIMPAMTIAVFQIAMIMRLVRAEMLGVLRADHIRFARARGLSDRSVNFRHALRNTLVPVVTIVGLQLGSIIAFAVITEAVFQWPGLGLLFLHSVAAADVPVMSAYLVMVGLLFVVINLIVDLLYYAIDPRIRAGRTVTAAGGAS